MEACNLKMASYWEWRAEAEHSAGLFSDEAKSAKIGKRRFPRDIKMSYADVRVLATHNDPELARYVEKRGAVRSNSDIDASRCSPRRSFARTGTLLVPTRSYPRWLPKCQRR